MIESPRARYPQVEAAILETHAYDTPETIQLPVQAG
ncbi:MAG: divalent cation tolerance protein CutA [Planctomycetota bacterium]